MLIEVSCGGDDPDLHVMPGATLVILEGTVVLLDQGASIRVHPGGSLVVRGTARLPVTFAPLPEFSVHDSTWYPGKSAPSTVQPEITVIERRENRLDRRV